VYPVGKQGLRHRYGAVGEDYQDSQLKGFVEGPAALEVMHRHVESGQLVLEPAEFFNERYYEVVQVGLGLFRYRFEAGYADVLYYVQECQRGAESGKGQAVRFRGIAKYKA